MRRTWGIRGLLAALAAALTMAAPAAAAPNFVLVLTDDQRWDTLFAMPTVQRELAGRGVTFANAFAVNPLCCPSRASFLTGRYSHSTGIYDNFGPHGGAAAFDDSSTVATWLQAAGYRTAYIGKYLNGYTGAWIPFGWNRWVGYSGGYFGYTLNVDGLPLYFGTDPDQYSTDVLAREAVNFIQTTAGPFFLVLAPYAPHGPMTPAQRHEGAFEGAERWRPPSYSELDVSDKPRWLRSRLQLSPEEQAATDEMRENQLETLLAVDEAVRRVIDALAASNRLNDTMIVFASDNGLTWGEHRQRNRKTSVFEESIRIPLVIRYDRFAARGRVETRLATNIDVAPTFAELAGVAAPRVDGRSLVPLLSQPSFVSPAWRESFLVEHMRSRAGAPAEVPSYCAVRRTRYKYVAYETREEELYDLATDPWELDNRAADPALRQLRFQLRLDLKELCDPPPPGFSLRWLCTLEGEPGQLVLRGTARSDTICATRSAEALHGLAGDDELRAGSGADRLYGGTGNDLSYPGPGRDLVSLGAGADSVLARDGQADRIGCGRGFDIVQADRRDLVARDCERVRRLRPRG